MRNTYHHVTDGETIRLTREQKIACCDCGLVHMFRFKRRGRSLSLTVWRDNRATAAKRRWRKVRGQ